MDEELDAMALRVARRYQRRCWWADVEDLYQEAWLAISMARRSFDPEYGVPFIGYATRAAYRWLRGVLWKASAPVSGRCEQLRGLHRAPLDELDGFIIEETPESLYAFSQWCERVREVTEEALDELEELDKQTTADLVAKETRPRHVAVKTDRPVEEIYRLKARAELELASSPALRRLWKEM